MAKKNLVIAVDNSKECLRAVDFAVDHFKAGYPYHLVHVQPKASASAIAASAAAAEFAYENMYEIEKEQTELSNKIMKEVFAPRAVAAGIEVLAVVLKVDGDSSSSVGQAICEYSEKIKAEALIVMRQNKSAINRFFLGSVTKYCAVHSHAPVIIVPISTS